MTGKLEVLERWKQQFNAHLNGVKTIVTEDDGNGGNDYGSAAKDYNDPTLTQRKLKDAIH